MVAGIRVPLLVMNSFGWCAGIRYIQENDYPVRGTWGLT